MTDQQTVTVQGFAWNSTTRTHSDKVLHEARNTIDAEAWIKRNEGKLDDLTILRVNDTFLLHNLLIEYGYDKAADQAADQVVDQRNVDEVAF